MDRQNKVRLSIGLLCLSTLFLRDTPSSKLWRNDDLSNSQLPSREKFSPELARQEEQRYVKDRQKKPPTHIYGGLPRYAKPLIVITNSGFIVGYDLNERKNPLYVCYFLPKKGPVGWHDDNTPKRPSGFYADPRIPGIPGNFLANTGYHFGHLAPNYAIASRYGSAAQVETFAVYNVVAMHKDANLGMWKKTENLECDYFANAFDGTWQIAGPIFDDNREFVGKHKTDLADAFYKIIIDEDGDRIRLLPFTIGQHPKGELVEALNSVHELERLTKLDYFPELPPHIQYSLENTKPTELWNAPRPKKGRPAPRISGADNP